LASNDDLIILAEDPRHLLKKVGVFRHSFKWKSRNYQMSIDNLTTMQTVSTGQLKPSVRSLVHLRKEMTIGIATQPWSASSSPRTHHFE
jgi:hypothetical protein